MTLLTQAIARLLLAPSWIVAAAVLVKGYAETGDGFSAGVIAALGILIQYLAFGPEVAGSFLPVRYAREISLSGLGIALAVTFLPTLTGDAVMTHYPKPGETVIHLGSLELLTAVAFDVGVFLLVFGFVVGIMDLIAHLKGSAR
jgi:multisubunit Na+/H+ antiporter MnhB subunit